MLSPHLLSRYSTGLIPGGESSLNDSFGLLQIKSNIGHSECSAGISGVIKAVLALEKGIIPGNPTFITPNPRSKLYSEEVTHDSHMTMRQLTSTASKFELFELLCHGRRSPYEEPV